MKAPKAYIYLPIAFSLVLIAGIVLGRFSGRIQGRPSFGQTDKITSILNFVQQQYVDTVNREKLTDKTIADMLQELDPHSAYMTADERKRNDEPLEGNFEGIGVEFNIIADTVRVMNVITGGPSENAGIHAGDRIVLVDDKPFTGKKVNGNLVMKTLRGKGGSKVKLSVKRADVPHLVQVEITRGSVPIYSIDAAYMLNKETGYIKLSRFAATSYDEFMTSFRKLQSRGMHKLILDLRGNGGGYLNIAVSLADEFLSKGKMIVYTRGRSVPGGGKKFIATAGGNFETEPLLVLVDENSASASEIIAGAIQDNDRGTILGRRSFGKGLVQEEHELPDGSAFRLTIARYYTPSGRCIQKPYTKGSEEYYQEELDRYKKGELLNADSIHFADSLKFHTPGGKTVYGGGGIMPDVFVPLDTAERNHYVNNLIFHGLARDYILDYADSRREAMRKKGFESFHANFDAGDLLKGFITYTESKGYKKEEAALTQGHAFLLNYLKATLARIVWDEESFYIILNTRDKTLNRAVEELDHPSTACAERSRSALRNR
ncbi:MAG TPA: S41 family peptidase [Bacteroidia bacterium]|nr:S41 family peptidase [Bacteroidia bacterium]